ncbi:FxsA family protein [Pseudenhygromyxa sp. WMMC2535]|nr:FxsA family protein [Pseudenhygromyxa sp. WMMC2535]
MGRLFLLFTLVPLAELYLLITIGGLMGVGPTIALVAITGLVGATLARREGRRALTDYREALTRGQLPEDGVLSGLLILVGGVMLITPGVLTDLFGLTMMLPPARRATAKLIEKRLQKRLSEGVAEGSIKVIGFGSGLGGGFGSPGPGRESADARQGAVVDAEVVEVDGQRTRDQLRER